MDASHFAGRLKELRQIKGLTQQELADAAELSAAGVADLEQGRRLPGWDTVIALAEALGVDLNEFAKPPASAQPKAGRGRPRKSSEATPEAETSERPTKKIKRPGPFRK